jgi:DNA polymerase III alpha subunit
MRLDKYSHPIFTEQDIFEAIYRGHKFSTSDFLTVEERTNNIIKFEEQIGFRMLPAFDPDVEIIEYDTACQSVWHMPKEYQELDIQQWVLDQCSTQEETDRVFEELKEFASRNMINLLRWLKYFVDNCTKENVVWGVGRGSSVASYVLYKIGVHSVDSMKYNLDWREFLR